MDNKENLNETKNKPKNNKFKLTRKTNPFELLGLKFFNNILKGFFSFVFISLFAFIIKSIVTKRDSIFKTLQIIFTTICTIFTISISFLLLHKGKISVFILFYFTLVVILNLIVPRVSGLFKSTYLPTNDEEAENLNIKNLEDYLNFVKDYLTNKNIILELLCLNTNIRETLFLNDEHISYIKKLARLDSDIKKVLIAKNNNNMHNERFSVSKKEEKEIITFNTRYVYYNKQFERVIDIE